MNTESLTAPIINIYNQMELDLIVEIAKRFDTYDSIGGTLEWQLDKIQQMGTLNADFIKTIARYSEKSEKEIVKMLKGAGLANIDFASLDKAYDIGAITVSPATILTDSMFQEAIDLSYKELSNTYRLIQTRALESAKQAYMDVINRSYIEVATGTYDYSTSIKRAVQAMARQGITAATYQRGGKIFNYSIEGTVRRDTLTAVDKLANKSSAMTCDRLGIQYVEISEHLGARVSLTNPIANHAGWQGKIYKLYGKDKYPNLKESTGYPDDILGLGGVNCRHRIYPFIPGVSVPNQTRVDAEENKRAYEATQKQRSLERNMRSLKKQYAAMNALGDKEGKDKLGKKIQEKNNELNNFCKAHGLVRDYSRELVLEQIS